MTSQISAGVSAALLGGCALALLQMRSALSDAARRLSSDGGLDEIFDRLHVIELREGDEYVRALWRRVRPQLRSAVTSLTLDSLEAVTPAEIGKLDTILQETVPELRRLTSAQPSATARESGGREPLDASPA